MMKNFILSALSFCAFTANANIIYDKSDVDEKDFIFDEHQCIEISQQVQKETQSRSIVGSAAKGAAVGAAGVAIAGGSGTQGAKTGAGIGVATGILGGSSDRKASQAKYEAEQELVVRNCMIKRGYSILN